MHCRRCSYDLHATTSRQCPECGTPFDPGDPASYIASPRWPKHRRAGRSLVWFGVVRFVVGLIPDGRVTIDVLALIVAWLGGKVRRGHLGATRWAMAIMIFDATATVLGLVLAVIPRFMAVPWSGGISAGPAVYTLVFLAWCGLNVYLLHACIASGRQPRSRFPLAVAAAVVLAAGLTIVGLTGEMRAESYRQTRQMIEKTIGDATSRFTEEMEARRPAGSVMSPAVSGSGGGSRQFVWMIRLSSWTEEGRIGGSQERVRLVIRCFKSANPLRRQPRVEIEVDPGAPDSRDFANEVGRALEKAGIDYAMHEG